jgi:hypothetical protein
MAWLDWLQGSGSRGATEPNRGGASAAPRQQARLSLRPSLDDALVGLLYASTTEQDEPAASPAPVRGALEVR